MAALLKMAKDVAPVLFAKPRVVVDHEPDYDADEISIDDVIPEDLLAALTSALKEVGLLVDFFQEPAGGLPPA